MAKVIGTRVAAEDQDSSFWGRLILLAVFFSLGIFLGQVLSGRVPASTAEELSQYLSSYLRLNGTQDLPFLSAIILYFRYPLLAFLLGFASLGVILLPLCAAVYGFSLSFSACCFTAAFGKNGILLALCVFGLRCLISIPCFFLLAVPSFSGAAALAALSFGRGKRQQPFRRGGIWWLRLGIVSVLLLLGVLAELFLTPHLLNAVLQRILF